MHILTKVPGEEPPVRRLELSARVKTVWCCTLQNDLHVVPAGGARESLQGRALPRRVRQGGALPQNRPAGGQDPGESVRALPTPSLLSKPGWSGLHCSQSFKCLSDVHGSPILSHLQWVLQFFGNRVEQTTTIASTLLLSRKMKKKLQVAGSLRFDG